MDVNGIEVKVGARVCVVNGDHAGLIGQVTYAKNWNLSIAGFNRSEVLMTSAENVAVITVGAGKQAATVIR